MAREGKLLSASTEKCLTHFSETFGSFMFVCVCTCLFSCVKNMHVCNFLLTSPLELLWSLCLFEEILFCNSGVFSSLQ